MRPTDIRRCCCRHSGRLAQNALPVFEPMQPDVLGAGSNFTNAFADYDNDGDLDLFVGFDGKPNRLYRNDKGTFTDVAAAAGVADTRPTRAAAWGDFDADGDPDLLLGFTPLKDASVLKLYRNNAGSFADATTDAGLIGADRRGAPAGVDRLRRRRRSRSLHRLSRSRQRAVSQRRRQVDRHRRVDRPRRHAAHRRRGVVRLRRGRRSRRRGRQHGRRCQRPVPQRRRQVHRRRRGRRRRVGRPRAEAGRRTAPSACAPPTSTATASSICSPPTTVRSASSAIAARACSRIDRRPGQIAIDSRYDTCAFADFDNDGTLDLYVNGTVTGGASWQDSLFRNTGSAFVDVTPAVDSKAAGRSRRAVGRRRRRRRSRSRADRIAHRRHASRHAQHAAGRRRGARPPRPRRRCARDTRPAPARRCACSPRARRASSARDSSIADPATTRRTTCRSTLACRRACRESMCR